MTKLMGSASSLKWILPNQHNKLDSSVNSSHLTQLCFPYKFHMGKKKKLQHIVGKKFSWVLGRQKISEVCVTGGQQLNSISQHAASRNLPAGLPTLLYMPSFSHDY